MLQMRRTNEQKSATRQRILDAAARLFRLHGIDAVGVDAIMHAAGLTHGGFYGHFSSKEALVAEVATASLARSAARWAKISREESSETARQLIVGSYLAPAHAAAMEQGCMLTTLGSDMARRPEAKSGIATSVRVMLEALERCLPAQGQRQVQASLSTMVGAVVLARLADDPMLAQSFLDAARSELLGEAASPPEAVGHKL